jgi:hypothetical protein
MGSYEVIVAGAGLGGLCVAAGLRRAGFRVLVLERDAGLASRPQGYRININLVGDTALRACLPESHFELYRDTSHRQIDASVDIFSSDLRPLLHRIGDIPETGPAPAAVDRCILRAILIDVAKDERLGCEVVDARPHKDGVGVQMSDGSSIQGDLLVAADGATSNLRKRYLPGHEPDPLGIAGIYGRTPLDTKALTWLPRGVVEQRFIGVTDGAGTTLALEVAQMIGRSLFGALCPSGATAEGASATGALNPANLWSLMALIFFGLLAATAALRYHFMSDGRVVMRIAILAALALHLAFRLIIGATSTGRTPWIVSLALLLTLGYVLSELVRSWGQPERPPHG